MANANLKQALQRVPVIPTERYERIWQAIADRTISDKQKNRLRVSALADGELSESERADAMNFLAANSDMARDTAIWKKLAAATAALPVPQISETVARQAAKKMTQRIQDISQNEQKMIEAVGDAAKTPAVSPERWQHVWRGIEARVQQKAARPAAKVVPISAAAVPERKVVSHRRWRWVLAATAAAAIIAIAALLQLGITGDEATPVAVENRVPNALDERYDSSLEFVNGEKVVCFYLKPESAAESGGDSRWLPD